MKNIISDKRLLVSVTLLSVIAVVAACAQSHEQVTIDAGHFQLFQCKHNVEFHGGSHLDMPVVLRIDTKTGHVDEWYEEVGDDKTKGENHWIAIEENQAETDTSRR